ncbi:MAG: COX15/CtaA family protein [Bacteroidetes bacterium]|nr:COX15/CtaA family protein [Bacteroidota bacterium]
MNKTPKIIQKWLMLGAILVVTMIAIGGITRLTQSGLSIVHWKPISGVVPPLSEADWLQEFEHYKSSPEFIKKNAHFNLDDFKKIFFWEYIHRLVGRLLGIVFIVPFVYFLIRRKIKDANLIKNLLVIFFLGALQGYAGWYMVKSGLVNNPYVSHYRLAIHLLLALLLLIFITWEILKIKYPIISYNYPKHRKIRNLIRFSFLLLIVQITYGAFTAGLKAGYIYQTFPKMGNEWFPDSIVNKLDLIGLTTLTNNPATVQFIHRWLGIFIFVFIMWLYFKVRKRAVSAQQLKSVKMVFHTTSLQVILGIVAILNAVPLFIGVLHQLIAVMLLINLVIAYYFFRYRIYS